MDYLGGEGVLPPSQIMGGHGEGQASSYNYVRLTAISTLISLQK